MCAGRVETGMALDEMDDEDIQDAIAIPVDDPEFDHVRVLRDM